MDHITNEEKSLLGIASGEYQHYLIAYGPTKGKGRDFARRGSIPSSDGRGLDQNTVVMELGDLIHSEIQAAGAGEDAEVRLEESRVKPGSAPGSRLLSFTVSIQPRGAAARDIDDSSSTMFGPARAGAAVAAAGAAAHKTADAGGGTSMGGFGRPQSGWIQDLVGVAQKQQQGQQGQQQQQQQQQQGQQQQGQQQQGQQQQRRRRRRRQQQQQQQQALEPAEVSSSVGGCVILCRTSCSKRGIQYL